MATRCRKKNGMFCEVFGKDFREIMASELVSMTGGLIAGLMLAFATDKILLMPGLFILLPGFMEMRGNISGSLSARLGSGLWLDALKPRWEHNRILRGNIIASFGLAMMVSLVLGIVAWAVSAFIFGINFPSLIIIALVAGFLSNIIEIPITIATTFWLFRKGHDPNNIMGPYVTTVGDVISVGAILFAIVIV